MLHFADMVRHDNENEEFSFTKLGALTLNVVRYLEQKKEPPDQATDNNGPEKEVRNPKADAEYVERGLQRIREFERRFRTK